jgi:hypothetical protein
VRADGGSSRGAERLPLSLQLFGKVKARERLRRAARRLELRLLGCSLAAGRHGCPLLLGRTAALGSRLRNLSPPPDLRELLPLLLLCCRHHLRESRHGANGGDCLVGLWPSLLCLLSQFGGEVGQPHGRPHGIQHRLGLGPESRRRAHRRQRLLTASAGDRRSPSLRQGVQSEGWDVGLARGRRAVPSHLVRVRGPVVWPPVVRLSLEPDAACGVHGRLAEGHRHLQLRGWDTASALPCASV